MGEPNRALRAARSRAGFSRDELAHLVAEHVYTRTGRVVALDGPYIAKLERGAIRWPNTAYRHALREVLGAPTDAALGLHVPGEAPTERPELDDDVRDRVALARQRPTRTDAATLDALGDVLAATRRLEDRIGAGPVLPGVRGQLAVAEGLTSGARGEVRDRLVGFAGTIHQYVGWLISEVGSPADARRHLDVALAAGVEIDDPDLVSLALSFRGHMAWRAHDAGAVITLSRAAARDHRVYPAQLAYNHFQEARGHGMYGDAEEVARLVGRAGELAALADEHRDDAPDAQYWYDRAFWEVQRGTAWHSLRDPIHAQTAVEALSAGLAAMTPDVAGSEWAATFRVRQAEAHDDAGDLGAAVEAALAVADTARALDSAPLRSATRDLHDALSARHPRATELQPLADRLDDR